VPYFLFVATRELAQRFGQRFRQIRRARAGTQERLAELTGLSQSRISRLENGEGWEGLCEVYEALRAIETDPLDLFTNGTPSDPVSVEIRELLESASDDARKLALEVLRLDAKRKEPATQSA